MPFEIPGQARASEQLSAALRGGRVHHAYLFSGAADAGVPEAARAFAQALLCPVDPLGCGICPACERARSGAHVDFLVIGVEAGAREVKVDAVRAVCGSLQLKAAEAARKVALVLDADRLSPAAQNALLKTLEEPPAQSVLVLASEADERLLPTIRSRCIRIGLVPPRRAAAASSTLHPVLRSLLAGRRGESALAALDLGAEVSDREQAVTVLAGLLELLRDAILAPTDAQLLNPGERAGLTALAREVGPLRLVSAMGTLNEALIDLEGNAAPRLQVEAAALRLARLA